MADVEFDRVLMIATVGWIANIYRDPESYEGETTFVGRVKKDIEYMLDDGEGFVDALSNYDWDAKIVATPVLGEEAHGCLSTLREQLTPSEPQGEQYSASRWPYTYANDFLRTHRYLAPRTAVLAVAALEVYREESVEFDFMWSRAVTSSVIEEWARQIEVAPQSLAEALATLYCEQQRIIRPVEEPPVVDAESGNEGQSDE